MRRSRIGCAILFMFAAIVCVRAECVVDDVCRAYGKADSVFVGKVVSISESTSKINIKQQVVFKVIRIFKGSPLRETTVNFFTERECKLEFRPGKRYLVFEDSKPDVFVNRTQELNTQSNDYRYALTTLANPPIFTISTRIVSLTEVEIRSARVEIVRGDSSRTITVDSDGGFRTILRDPGKYTVRITIPRVTKAVATYADLIGFDIRVFSTPAAQTVIEYDLEFIAFGCDLREINLIVDPTAKTQTGE